MTTSGSRVTASITHRNLFDERVEAIMTLLTGRDSLLSFAEVKKYHRPISWQAPIPTKFPACFVSPERWEPDLQTNGKYEFWGQVGLYVYHDGNDPDAVGEEASNTVSLLDKMFSNNALDDLNTAGGSRKFFVNPGFWIMSRFGPVTISPILSYQREAGERFLAAAKCTFRFFDVLIHS